MSIGPNNSLKNLFSYQSGCPFSWLVYLTVGTIFNLITTIGWATQLLKNNVSQATVMAMGGWSDLDTMMRYIRLSGIELTGATQSLNLKKERLA